MKSNKVTQIYDYLTANRKVLTNMYIALGREPITMDRLTKQLNLKIRLDEICEILNDNFTTL